MQALYAFEYAGDVGAGPSVTYTRRATRAAQSKAQSKDRRDRTPVVVVELEKSVFENDDSETYLVRNDGPQELESVVIHPTCDERPRRLPAGRHRRRLGHPGRSRPGRCR